MWITVGKAARSWDWGILGPMRKKGPRDTVVVGVGGGIAAYKAGDLVRRLLDHDLRVRVVMTPMATRFVSPLTFQALSGEPVLTDLADPSQDAAFGHLELGRTADLFIVAPATADLLAKVAHGFCDDPVTTTVVATRAPLVICPAMNTAMWENRQVQDNLAALARDPRVTICGPASGKLADGDVGFGRLAEVADIVTVALGRLRPQDLVGAKVLVTAGPTREPLDPVRFLSTPSTGRMGYALAEAAASRGAKVTLVSGPVELAPPAGVERVLVETAEQMLAACVAALPGTRIVVAAAAVSDYKPKDVLTQKKKKSAAAYEEESLALVRTPDVLQTLSKSISSPARPVFVGFAAETENLLANAHRKLADKGLDLVVANSVGQPGSGFAADDNQATLVSLSADEPLPRMSKRALADRILDWAVAKLEKR